MRIIKVGAAVLNQTPFDWLGNESRIKNVLDEARSRHISILCLPELCISGYGCEDAFHMPHLSQMSWEVLDRLVPFTKGMLVSFGLPVLHRGALFNTIAVVADGRLVALIPKKLLAGDGVHYEPRWFKPWPTGMVETYQHQSLEIPIGDLVLNCGDVKVGFEICEEAWVANRPGATLARLGVDVVLNPSASHFAFGKRQVRERFVAEGSRAFHVAYLYSNLLGNESGRIIFDGGAIIASQGEMVASGKRFSFKDWDLTEAIIDVDLNRMMRARTGSFQPLIGDDRSGWVETLFSPSHIDEPVSAPKSWQDPWEKSVDLKNEEFYRSVSLGLFDFLRKSKMSGFSISLSGGVDSTVVSLLCAGALRLAQKEIGFSGIKERLGYDPKIHRCHNLSDMMKLLIHTVYQATENSGDQTEKAAREVALACDATFYRWDIGPVVSSYKSLVGDATSTQWNWDDHDIALQNIQARARGPGVWMLANLHNHLLLATSNRSEAAVGYATMDGDTCGGLSPLSGVDKAFLRTWLRWMESVGPQDVGPCAAVKYVTQIPPTAELRPKDRGQTDEKDLMPYDVLDTIERAAVRDKKSPQEVLYTLTGIYPHEEQKQLSAWVEKFFKLWCRNQWKRERYAPGFHLDDESLDPKTWCRFPILSGNFTQELSCLKTES